jgi:hypothetical protein
LSAKKPFGVVLSIMTIVWLWSSSTAGLLPAAAQPAALAQPAADAQQVAGVAMEALAAFGGHFKYGEWLPVWVYLENRGSDLEVEARVRVTGRLSATTYARHVSMPAGSRKRVPVYVLPNNFSRELEVQLVDTEENLLLSRQVAVKPQANVTLLVGIVALERGAMSLISAAEMPGQRRPKVLVDLSVDELPERVEGLRSFDVLILNDVDTSSVTPGQRQALEAWVGRGGQLVIGGGAGARRTASGLPESMLPVVPDRELEVDALPGLAEYLSGTGDSGSTATQDRTERVRVPGPFVIAAGHVGEGRTLAEQEGLPLIRERVAGSGSVCFVALDLASSPFDAWAGTVRFWERLIMVRAAYPQNLPPDLSPRQMRSNQMVYALTNLPSLALPSVRGLSVLLVAYILLVGPINYLVLRWRKRLHWAWVTIPVLTLLFSGGAFGLGYALRGTDLILNQISIVDAQPDGTARVDSFIGLFSPSRQSYEIEVRGDSLLSTVNPEYDPFGQGGDGAAGEVHLVQGDPGQVRGLAINQWSMQTFMAEGTWPDLGQITSDLHFEGSTLVGTVRNGTGQTLQDVVIVIGTQFQRLGELAPGAEREVQLSLFTQDMQLAGPPISYRLFEEELSTPGPGGPPRDVQLKQQVLDSVLNSGGIYSPLSSFRPRGGGGTQELTLLAWFDRAPPDVRVAGRQPAQRTTALLHTPLTYQLAESGEVVVPAGFVPSRVLSMPIEGGPCGPPGIPAVYINRGEATFEFELPAPSRQVRIERLTLSLRSEGGWQQPPRIAVYDWSEESWSELEEPVIGDNVLTDVEGLVGDAGLVHARLVLEGGGGGGCYALGLGFEGTSLAGGGAVVRD